MLLDALFTSDLVPARLVASYLPAIEVSGTKLLLLQQTLEGRFNDLSEDFGLSPSRFRRCLEENWSFVAGSHAIRYGLGGHHHSPPHKHAPSCLPTSKTNPWTNSSDVPHEVRKTEEERRRDWINFMEAVGKLWIAGEEFWSSGGTALGARR
ncbi:hypothetical protein K435DRAFT_853539 [Dendrothele bispora CBS 962.96]|uniref:Uncharacterized protein n=1 Tax=Dendrothele bispora (strain CBS 962.96) TaxID=1314807 RepID=A0A4S8MGB6_DENBC|nr:hypothetical protein K435DRAFT_853539 [Dendrothele bispora CBS 962.96]